MLNNVCVDIHTLPCTHRHQTNVPFSRVDINLYTSLGFATRTHVLQHCTCTPSLFRIYVSFSSFYSFPSAVSLFGS